MQVTVSNHFTDLQNVKLLYTGNKGEHIHLLDILETEKSSLYFAAIVFKYCYLVQYKLQKATQVGIPLSPASVT